VIRLRLRAGSFAALVVLSGGLVSCAGDERQATGREATTRATAPPIDRGVCQRVGTFHGEALRLCFQPNANDHGRFVLSSGATAREVAVSPPGPTAAATDAGKIGHWAWGAVSPDEKTLLAQWSAECEVPIAFLVDLANGAPTPVTGEADWAESPMSLALGWTTDGRAIVFLPQGGGCGAGASPPGVYLYSEAGEGALLISGKKTPINGTTRPRSVAALRQAGS
jgi:hypothetical protein